MAPLCAFWSCATASRCTGNALKRPQARCAGSAKARHIASLSAISSRRSAQRLWWARRPLVPNARCSAAIAAAAFRLRFTRLAWSLGAPFRTCEHVTVRWQIRGAVRMRDRSAPPPCADSGTGTGGLGLWGGGGVRGLHSPTLTRLPGKWQTEHRVVNRGPDCTCSSDVLVCSRCSNTLTSQRRRNAMRTADFTVQFWTANCHQMTTQTHPRGGRGLKCHISDNFRVPLKSLKNSNFWAFGGVMAQATWA